MRIDAYTHFFPKKFFDMLGEAAADYPDMGKRVRSLPALYDLDVRKRIVDGHKDYQQILAYPQPPIEKFAKTGADIDAFCRVINDGFAELIAKEKDHFPGWVAHVSLAAPDAGDLHHLVEELLREEMRVGVDAHQSSPVMLGGGLGGRWVGCPGGQPWIVALLSRRLAGVHARAARPATRRAEAFPRQCG